MRRLFVLLIVLGAVAVHPSASFAAQSATATCGEFRHEVEATLAKLGGYGPADPDCASIKRFQDRIGLKPVDGIAGPATRDVARRLAASDPDQCDAADGGDLVACVDLTHQTTWLMQDGIVVYAPTVMRSGMADFATPTGTYEVQWRDLKSWSVPYKVWLPYWQSFNGGIGFHQTTSYLHKSAIGSHGCINLLPADATAYWDKLGEGSIVQVFGHRAGT